MMQNNIKIAITGGIGSGKSTVSAIISELGYNVVSCDKIYKDLLNNHNFAEKISSQFEDILTNTRNIDKVKLSAIVFSDKRKLKLLNDITHPEIMKQAFKLMSDKKICFCEVPLLFENGLEKEFDRVLVVLRNLSDRIISVSKRDGISVESVKNRIKAQIDYDNYDFAQYYVIHNSGDITELREQVLSFLKKIM